MTRKTERGYAMAALLVALAIMSVVMMAALPAWRFQARREKEAELAFRGEQWARAISLYQRKNGTFPPNLDVLVQGRFVRKKYKDPFSPDGEFLPQYAGVQPQPGQPGQPQPGGRSGAGASGRGTPPAPPTFPGNPGTPGGQGGVIGVRSKSKEASIRVYKGTTHYNEWPFNIAVNQPGGGPGGRGGPGIGRGRGADRPGMPPGQGPGRGGFPGGPGRGGRGTFPGGRGGRGPTIGFPGGGRGPGQ